MPELPEVESVRRQLAPVLVGRRIVRVAVTPQARFDRVADAQGARVASLARRGKYLLAALEGHGEPRELIMHLGMTGSFRVRGRDGWFPDGYVRASLHLDVDIVDFRDVRRFGRLAVVRTGDYSRIATLAALGPEPLSDDFDPKRFADDLARTRMPVKPYLLTQRPVAGVGNIYADEALWSACINPRSRRLGPGRAQRLWQSIRQVLADAITREGTTFRDYQMVDGQSGRNADFLRAYGQAGRPCARCDTALRRIDLGGRGTTYCPRCQAR
jgi:formamidopyrimidine-DNA glycosylase